MKGKVLITGGAGFIGSHTADLLIDRGYDVIILDALSDKTHNGIWPSYINDKAKKVLGCVTDPKIVTQVISEVDYVIHLAAEMDLNPDFQKFMSTNVGGTALIYELIVKNNYPIKKVVVASSQFVYGDGIWKCETHGEFKAPIRSNETIINGLYDHICPVCGEPCKYIDNTEESNNPPNHYALSKLFQEQLSIQLGKLYKIPSTAARYSIVHGPRQSLKNTYSGALRNFAISIDLGIPLATFEDNLSTRDFVSVYDVARANVLLLESEKSNYEVFNIGSGERWNISQLADSLSKAMGKPHTFSKKIEFRPGDIRHAISNISKINKLGWWPEISEEDTLEEYVKWFKMQEYDKDSFVKTQALLREKNIVMNIEKNQHDNI